MAGVIVLPCPRCQSSIQLSEENGRARCFFCAMETEATIFPALLRPARNAGADVDVISDEASCFFHPQRVAVFTCSRCGRFLCHLCRISWADENLCPLCVELKSQIGPSEALPSSRFHFDSLALAVSALPIAIVFITLLTAPLALGLGIFTFNRECSVAPRSRFRFAFAILLALAQIGAWTLLFIYALHNRPQY